MVVTTGQEPRRILPAPGLRVVIDIVTASHARAVAFLVGLALLSFLPGFFQIPPVDRDEARFAQATRQMIENGDYVDIRFQDESRYKKPVGIYWLQAAVVKTAEAVGMPQARTRIWLYRIPSLLGAVGAVLLTYWTALAFVSRRAAVLAGAMMATCVLLGVEARLAKTDAMLLMTSAAAMGALGRIYLAGQGKPLDSHSAWLLPAILWTAVAGGILLKGPLILMFIGLAAATLAIADRDAKWLLRARPIAGLIWILLLALPWFVAILLRSGETFFSDSVGQDLFAKVVSGQESHGAPPGSYFVMFWGTFWPGSILAGLAALPVWNARREPGARFLLAWLVPSWIVFEIVATKLPHYVLPLYPAVAILIAGVIDQHALLRRRWLEAGTAWWFIICAALALAAILAHIVIGQQLGLLAWPFAAAAVIFALLAWRLYEVDGAELSLVRACIASVCVSFMVYGATFPALPTLFPAEELASEMRGVDCKDPMIATAGYHEPSLVLLTSTDLRHTDGAGAAEFLRPGGCRFVFVESRQERSFVQRADAIGLRYALESRVEGYNISGGRKISVAIFRAEGDQ